MIISKNDSNQLLQQTIIEVRRDLKSLDSQPEFTSDPYFRGRFFYRYRRWALLLRAKWIFHLSQEIFETQNNKPEVFYINGHQVELSEYSLIHIVNRHFVQLVLSYPTGKSYHTGIFDPRGLGKQINSIFAEINNNYIMARIDKVFFVFKSCIYAMWIADKIKHVKGKNVPYKRLETIYPIEDQRELMRIQNEYREIKITNEIRSEERRVGKECRL